MTADRLAAGAERLSSINANATEIEWHEALAVTQHVLVAVAAGTARCERENHGVARGEAGDAVTRLLDDRRRATLFRDLRPTR